MDEQQQVKAEQLTTSICKEKARQGTSMSRAENHGKLGINHGDKGQQEADEASTAVFWQAAD
jgi:hypothetical protein